MSTGVAEKPHRDVRIRVAACGDGGIDLGFVSVGAVQEALRHHAGKQPVERRDFRDVALAVENDVLRIESAGEPRCRNLHAAALDACRILALDERMQVGEEEEAFNVRIPAVLNGGRIAPT